MATPLPGVVTILADLDVPCSLYTYTYVPVGEKERGGEGEGRVGC